MRLSHEAITSNNLQVCRSLWGDRDLWNSQELEHLLQEVSAWLREDRARGTILFDDKRRPRFFGLTVFAPRDTVDTIVRRPQPRLAVQLRNPNGRFDVLTEQEIGRGNASDGLDLVVLYQGYKMDGATSDDWATLMGAIVEEFLSIHRGFRIVRALGEVFGQEGVDILNGGAWANVENRAVTDMRDRPLPSARFWMTRHEAIARWSPLLPMFTYAPPLVQFTAAEKELLRHALQGATDVSLSTLLGISLPAVKSRWTRAYQRIVERSPGVLPVRGDDNAARGSQIRHLMLEFVRRHPAELTPFSSGEYDALGRSVGVRTRMASAP